MSVVIERSVINIPLTYSGTHEAFYSDAVLSTSRDTDELRDDRLRR